MSRVTASTDFDRIPEKEVPRYVSIFCEQVARVLSGNIDFSTNFNGKLVAADFTAADTELTITHGLGRIPIGYILTKSNAGLAVYDGSTEANSLNIYLKSSAIGTVTLLIF